MSSKLTERLAVSNAANWVPIADYSQFMGVGVLDDADTGETVTVTLRKATDVSGTNAANHGSAVVATSTGSNQDLVAKASAYAADLGKTVGGVAYTHVSATVTDTASPESSHGVVIRGDGRYSEAV